MENIKTITRSGLLIGLSIVGSLIKIQGTIAFDSMPGYFAALFISPMTGSFVATLGHLLTSVTSGFPLTIPLHLIVALQMGLFAYIFGILHEKTNGIIVCTIATILNGPIATYTSSIAAKALGLPFSGATMFKALIVPLTVASLLNIVLAYIIFKILIKYD